MLIQYKAQNQFNPLRKLRNVTLEQVHQYDYLGMTLHDKLTQIPHLNKLNAKTYSTIYTLAKLRKFITAKTAVTIFKSCILSQTGIWKYFFNWYIQRRG